MYLNGIDTKFNQVDRNYDGEVKEDGLNVFSPKARPFGAYTYENLTNEEREMGHWYVLQNCENVEPYLT